MEFALRVHQFEEFLVGLGAGELPKQELHALNGGEGMEDLPEYPHLRKRVLVHEEFFLPRARGADVDGGVYALLDELLVEVQFHVPRALELLENHVVHTASRVHQSGRENR